MVEFNVRIDFYRELEGSPKEYVGSALHDGLRALVVPRVGEYVHGLGPSSVWYGPAGRTGGPYSAVAAVEHAPVPAFKADPSRPRRSSRLSPWWCGRCGLATAPSPASACCVTMTSRVGSCTFSASTPLSRRFPISR